MVTKTPSDVLKKIERIVRQAVEERFGDDFVFDPVLVIAHEDYWDNERVFIYVVYDGDFDKLDPEWTVALTGRVIEQTTEEELPLVPIRHFIHKSEWPVFYRYNVARWIPATS